MATRLSALSSLPLPSSPHPIRCRSVPSSCSLALLGHLPLLRSFTKSPRKCRFVIVASSSASSFDDFSSEWDSSATNSSKKSLLSTLIQEIEPLDVTLIQKDVPPTTLDAMKRTISSMLGLLPSDRFQVTVEALWEPLSKLLVSSMMTGYTLRNAECRLCLERNLGASEGDLQNQTQENSKADLQGTLLDSYKGEEHSGMNELSSKPEEIMDNPSDNIGIQGFKEMSPEVQQYILHMQSRLSSAKKELCEVKRKCAALQMQQFVGEEKNDLLDYLRSLQPEKKASLGVTVRLLLWGSKVSGSSPRGNSLLGKSRVAELSEPTCPEVKETIHSVVHGLLATLSPRIHSKAPSSLENPPTGTVNSGSEDCAELVENTYLQFQPHVSLTRDYLARLLFWCMLLGHYLRGLEYRMELTRLLSLTSNAKTDAYGNEQVA